MIDKQEITGASNNPADAQSLAASRGSPRARKRTQKGLDYDPSSQLASPPHKQRSKRKANFTIHQDLPTPLPTQLASQPTQQGPQKGTDPSTSRKKRRKATKKDPKAPKPAPEPWEVNFEAAKDAEAKIQVLLEAFRHEEFSDSIPIPKRLPTISIKDEDVDLLNPLRL